MRFFLSLLSFCMVAAILGGAALFAWGAHQYMAAGPLREKTIVVVERGEGLHKVSEKLLYQGIVSVNGYHVMKIAARATGQHTALKAGEYEFDAHASVRDILDKMAAGDVVERRITVREGLTSWQVAQLVNAADNLAGDPVTDIPPEGSLLPDTYLYTAGETRQAKLDQMKAAMDRAVAELWPARDPSISVLSEREAVILASIVEKETGVASERARIAGVFHNRLRRGIPLQSDPTVIYALTNGRIQDEGMGPLGRRLLTADLQTPSPYNTYKNAGLPAGPIANPGIDSLKAVLNPEKHDFIYFVADGTGGHVFARTLEEHNANVAKWRQIRKNANN